MSGRRYTDEFKARTTRRHSAWPLGACLLDKATPLRTTPADAARGSARALARAPAEDLLGPLEQNPDLSMELDANREVGPVADLSVVDLSRAPSGGRPSTP